VAFLGKKLSHHINPSTIPNPGAAFINHKTLKIRDKLQSTDNSDCHALPVRIFQLPLPAKIFGDELQERL
jgi:hypothetical protein